MPARVPRKTKNVSKARTKLSVQNQRSILAYKDLAKAAASGLTTKISKGSFRRKEHYMVQGEGGKLKDSMLAMGERASVSQEDFEKIAKMDPDKLAEFYQQNDIAFEVFFNYEGISGGGDGKPYVVSDQKKQDIKWFISQYEKVYGRIQ